MRRLPSVESDHPGDKSSPHQGKSANEPDGRSPTKVSEIDTVTYRGSGRLQPRLALTFGGKWSSWSGVKAVPADGDINDHKQFFSTPFTSRNLLFGSASIKTSDSHYLLHHLVTKFLENYFTCRCSHLSRLLQTRQDSFGPTLIPEINLTTEAD
jgi:hypothetical protein